MSCDKLVYDLAQEVEGTPNIFVRKDWLNILDNQNTNYQNNQSIIDTSQLSNSNKYMAYREAYLSIPLLLSVRLPTFNANIPDGTVISDYSCGLKNWFGQIIHSFTLDYNGTTIIQQTPYINMWNSFKLITSLSYNDIITQGPTLGFYPDTSDSWSATIIGSQPYVSNVLLNNFQTITGSIVPNATVPVGNDIINDNFNGNNTYNARTGNYGLAMRTKWIAYNPTVYSNFKSSNTCNQTWQSYITKTIPDSSSSTGYIQYQIMATVYLKHVSSFFNMCPLLKGVFMKMTMNLNNASSQVGYTYNGTGVSQINSIPSNVAVGGVNPIMANNFFQQNNWMTNIMTNGTQYNVLYNLSVGYTCLDNSIFNGITAPTGQLSKSIYLYVPAYTFNPTFEKAYLSNNIKQIKYTDVYQYQVKSIEAGQPFNNLITNGIANIKSVLILPFLSGPTPEFQSAVDPAGTGPTAPMVTLGNFNVQISGQNAIYNMQRYGFEEWNNQLYGENAINGGLTDGLTSGLISYADWQQTYCYYYVNVERMLPVEQSVPKSVQIIGTNFSGQKLDFIVFVEYGVSISLDLLTGARV